jgi:hypothetical protein
LARTQPALPAPTMIKSNVSEFGMRFLSSCSLRMTSPHVIVGLIIRNRRAIA